MMQDKSPLVLYVDDDADDRMLLTDVFQQTAPGYRIDTAIDGFAALDYLRNKPELPGLVIMDLNMPGLNGKEVIRELKNDPRLQHVPIVAFTTSANPSDRMECARFGVDMVTKPITFDDLTRTVNILLGYCKKTA